MPRLRPPVKTHGGKYYLSDWIIDNFPSNYESLKYGEVFVGGGSVLLHKKKSVEEFAFDLDLYILCIWRSLKKEPLEFIARLKALKYSDETFQKSRIALETGTHGGPLDIAVHEYVVRRMSRGGMRKSFAWSERLRGGQPGDLNAWETSLDNLPKVVERVKDVTFNCYDFRVSMGDLDSESVLLYLDPPYVKSTRAKGSTDVYSLEMTNEDHSEMLNLCKSSKSRIVISGYNSTLYNDALSSWNKVYKDVPNHAGQTAQKKTNREVLWKNF